MKYAFMSFSCPELTLDEMLAAAETYGYDGIEPRIEANHAHGIEVGIGARERQEIKAKAGDSGVALCCVATSRRYADPKTAQDNVDSTLQCIDLAADLGAPRIRVFGGRLGEGLSREAAIDLVAKSLRAVADRAQARGVTVCMETHDDWCDPAHVVAVMELANHPAIAVNWDVMHPIRVAGWTVGDAFAALKPWLAHMHVHDGMQREKGIAYCPMGEGIVDTRRAIQLTKANAYDGYLSGEWIGWEPYGVHLPRELATMKQYEAGD
jgi:sugar phosphate isomerase/epimerase